MKFAVHDAIAGGFRLYEAPATVPINNDFPTPVFGRDVSTKLGVPAILAGRPLPSGAVPAGASATAVGHVSSGVKSEWSTMAKGGLPSGLGSWEDSGAGRLGAAALGLAAIGVGVCAYVKGRDPYEDSGPALKVAALVFTVAGLAALGNASGVLRYA